MTIFIRLISRLDKLAALKDAVISVKDANKLDSCVYEVDSESFRSLAGSPFIYWAGEKLLLAIKQNTSFEPNLGSVRVGAQTDDDYRFVRNYWEVNRLGQNEKDWPFFLKGDRCSPFYDDIKTVLYWNNDAKELKQFISQVLGGGHWSRHIFNSDVFFRPGISWALRTARFSPSCVPEGCIPSVSRYLALSERYSPLAMIALWSSLVVDAMCKLRLERHEQPKFISGAIKTLAIPTLNKESETALAELGARAWKLRRSLMANEETSHAFTLPLMLRVRVEGYDPYSILSELTDIQLKIDNLAFILYGLDETDRLSLSQFNVAIDDSENALGDIDEEDEAVIPVSDQSGLYSWAVGVAFGRFDWRLATGERTTPAIPDPFDRLPSKSPGMLPDGVPQFHSHGGILVDDQGHQHDLARLVEEVLARVNVDVPDDMSRWLRKDFFAFHLQRYSKSRRKAPIYWPLATASSSYTLWIYYPSLTNQTLFTAVNDFLDGPNGKLTQISRECAELRVKGSSRSSNEEKKYETLQSFEQELTDLRDTLVKIAPNYHPNHNDGVQITAAPLWQLFRHKPWQKVLKDTWAKLEKGDYDWAHLAMVYWPERVLEKCRIDKSLAIAHGREDLYIVNNAASKKTRNNTKNRDEQ